MLDIFPAQWYNSAKLTGIFVCLSVISTKIHRLFV